MRIALWVCLLSLPPIAQSAAQPAGQSAVNDKFDPIHVDGTWLRDSAGRVVILRGVTTITMNNDGKPMVMTGADYDRIKAWGFNVQQIRLAACPLGLLPPCKPDPEYLAKLESWVAMGEERGIYTIFKATTYDIPGLGFQQQFRRGAWDRFWDTSSGWQSQFIDGWKAVWRYFKGRSSVIGYDILNETSPGSNTPHFNRDHLLPFYRKAQAALAGVDRDKLLVYQPSLRADDGIEPLGGTNVLYAPHFYPMNNDPDGMWRDLLSNAAQTKAPLLIGEYGLPNTAFQAGISVKAATPERDQADAALFDHASLGTIKTWYTSIGNWALLMPDGSETARMRYFVRPYPQRTAGTPAGFSFDFATHEWTFEWKPDPSVHAPTVIYIPAKRHYPTGFEASIRNRYDSRQEILTVEDTKASKIVVRPRK